jgi:hypothetical protein
LALVFILLKETNPTTTPRAMAGMGMVKTSRNIVI